MALVSIAEQNLSLDLYYGANKGSIAASAHELALFVGDPSLGTSTELTSAGGYARVTVANDGTNWPAAADGAKTSAAVTFADSTDAWSGVPTHWQLFNVDTGDAGDSGVLDPTVSFSIDGAGVVVNLTLTIYYDGGLS
jgi:hypothetical protein